MNRPEVSVVMPFSGDPTAARAAAGALRSLGARAGDELILVDNSGAGVSAQVAHDGAGEGPALQVVTATGERSPAHARNLGAARARHDWILFLDADTTPREELLETFFAEEIDDDVGAIAGEVVPAGEPLSLAARYGAARNFLGQEAHQAHPYRPRAAAANLLVRRSVFEQLGGFYEGVRAAEDTDFTWRLQEAGWRLGLRADAVVEHQYRPTIAELRRQWRSYAAGRAWLGRRYDGFEPQPALSRAARRLRRPGVNGATSPGRKRGAPPVQAGGLERSRFLALDAVLSLEELAGLALSNRPVSERAGRADPVDIVLVADRFPVPGDPLVELAETLERVRVESATRPPVLDASVTRRLTIDYLEDDGSAGRWVAALWLLAAHPRRVLADLLRREPDAVSLRVVAPAARRLERDRGARLHPLGGGRSHALAERLARLAGRALE